MSSKTDSSGCFLAIGIFSLVVLALVLWGNIMDDMNNKETTSPILTFVLFVLGVGGIIGYSMTKNKND